MLDQDIVGVVLPILPKHVTKILDGRRSVLVKYISRIPKKREAFRLRVGMKVVFYVSRSGRRLAGEGEIRRIEFMSPKDTISKYRARLLLSETELYEYTRKEPGRTEKPMLVMSLTNLRTYPEGVIYPKNISMVGEYLTRNVYNVISEKKETTPLRQSRPDRSADYQPRRSIL